MMPRVQTQIREVADQLVTNVERRFGLSLKQHIGEFQRDSLIEDAVSQIEQAVNQGVAEEKRLASRDITSLS